MNREIKFRAWDKRFKWMKYGAGDLLLILNEKDYSEAMQFTGLKDKNGKEIYEGDIVEGHFIVDEVEDYIRMELSDEERKTGTKLFLVEDIHFGYVGYVPVPANLRVIGNIYENPELLDKLSK